ncbi:MAG: hypothetical protein M1813_008272 [Trichoglossum hirsutum]|nr:MAG: hypothetical protein M1813_008272 [Trichoglossum hirsutum]
MSSIDDSKILRNSSRSIVASSPPKYADEQRRISNSISRKNSIKRPSSNEGTRDSSSLIGPGSLGSHQGSMNIGHNQRLEAALTSAIDASIAAFSVNGASQAGYPNEFSYPSQGSEPSPHHGDPRDHDPLGHLSHDSNRGGLPYFNGNQTQTSDIDWPNLFQTGTHDTLMNPLLQSSMSHGQMPTKSGPPLGNGSYESTTDNRDGIFHNLY